MVHIYKLNGLNIALDVESGSIHVVDDLTYDIIEDFKKSYDFEKTSLKFKNKFDNKVIDEIIDELRKLIEDGMLFTDDEENKKSYEERKINDNTLNLKALCLHVAHDCNLACDYCFADKGTYKSEKGKMNTDTAIRAVDFLVKNSGKRRNIEIDFFGGEPLLNMETVKETVKYSRSIEEKNNKSFYFTITTNGILLNDENTDFINKYMDNVVISIDGRKEIHDSIRKDNARKGTYDRILPKTKKLIAGRKNKSHFIRSTFTANNLDFTEDFKSLIKNGFKEISIEPAVGRGQSYSIKKEMLSAIYREYEKLAKVYIEEKNKDSKLRFYHYNMQIYEGPCLYKRINACGAGYEYFAVSPEGDLFPCHQFVGTDAFKIGNIFDGIENKKLSKEFENNNVFSKKECMDCFAKYHCSGGCHSNAYFVNGDIKIPDDIMCDLQRKRVECAIMIKAHENQ